MSRSRGHVRQRGGGWVVILSEIDPVTKSRKRRYHSGFATKAEAEKARTRLLGEMDRGEYLPASKVLVADYLLGWLGGQSDRLKPTTFDSYRSQIEGHVIPRIGGVRLSALTPMRIQAMYTDLRSSGRLDGRGGLSQTSVQYLHRILRKAFSDAVRQGTLPSNPFDRVDPPRRTKDNASASMDTWRADEVASFLAHVAGDGLYCLWHLAATTGMRRGELLGLQWSDVDLEGKVVQVVRNRVAVRFQPHVGSPKTSSSYRSIALDETTVRVVKSYRSERVAEALRLGRHVPPDEFVFANADGTPIHPDHVTKTFRRLSASAGLPRIRFHDLRHTYATLALRAGVHPKVVSERLGHSSIGITLDRYSHAIPAMQADAAQLVADLIAEGGR